MREMHRFRRSRQTGTETDLILCHSPKTETSFPELNRGENHSSRCFLGRADANDKREDTLIDFLDGTEIA